MYYDITSIVSNSITRSGAGPERSSCSSHSKPWASYQIRKIAGCACAGNAGNVFPAADFQGNGLVSYPGMHHGTCVTHVPWCMSGSLTYGDEENVPGIPGACANRNIMYLVRGPWSTPNILAYHCGMSCSNSNWTYASKFSIQNNGRQGSFY